MKRSMIALCAWLVGCTLVAPSATWAKVRLPAVFSDHMVLQRNAPLTVWGWADPSEQITVRLAEQEKATKADAAGDWQVQFDGLAATEPQTLSVAGTNTLVVRDVLLGEVWLCSGQSNMGVPLIAARDGEKEVAAASDPLIRFFTVTPKGLADPAATVDGRWQVFSPQTAGGCTAVGYFFARELRKELNVPIGLLHVSVGGSLIEGWVRREALDTIAELRTTTAAHVERYRSQPDDIQRYPQQRESWETRHQVRPPENKGLSEGWARPDFDDHDWPVAAFPAGWSDAAGVKTGGVFWLRKEVEFPERLAGKSCRMNFNFMHGQYDTAYFNGVEVGRSGEAPPNFDMSPRRYDVPGKLVRAGKNLIALRIVSADPRANLLGRGAYGDYDLPLDRKAVGNRWRVKVESLFPPLSAEAIRSRPRPNDAGAYNTSTVIFNAMIHPLLRYRTAGVIWYQGESNTSRPASYERLFTLLIEDWRRLWGQHDLPFYFVQLASYLPKPKDASEESPWARVREAQAAVAAKVPHTGMAVTIDVGEGDNIHPINKQDVGRRLALAALAGTYGRTVESVGPTYKSMTVSGSQIRVELTHAEGLHSVGGAPRWFAVAGEDRKFHWAEARLDADTIVVSSPEVTHPIAVRYAWANNPEAANLFNAANLPAAPFRSDDW